MDLDELMEANRRQTEIIRQQREKRQQQQQQSDTGGQTRRRSSAPAAGTIVQPRSDQSHRKDQSLQGLLLETIVQPQ